MKTNDIVRLSTQIAELEKRIKAISATQSVDSNLVNIKEYLVEMKELLTDLNALVTEYTTQTDTHESQIFNLLQRVASLEEQVANLATFDHVQIESDIDSLQASLADLQAQIASIDLSALQARVAQNESDIAELQTKIGDISGSSASTLESLDQDIANIKGNSTTSLEVLENDISALQTDVASNEDDIADLNTEISGINESIGDQNTTIANLQSAQNSLSGAQTSLNSTVNSLNSRLTTAESNISNLSGGNIGTNGETYEEYISHLQNIDFYKAEYDRTILSTELYFGHFKFSVTKNTIAKVTAKIFYTSGQNGTLTVCLKQDYSTVNLLEHKISLATHPNFYELTYYTGNEHNSLSVALNTNDGNVVLKQIEYFVEGKNVQVHTNFDQINVSSFDGVNYFVKYGETDTLYLYNPTNKMSNKLTNLTYNTAGALTTDYSIFPKLEKTTEGTLTKNGYYLFGKSERIISIIELDENFTELSNKSLAVFNLNSPSCTFNTDDNYPVVVGVTSNHRAYYANYDTLFDDNISTDSYPFKLNGQTLTRNLRNITCIINQNLTAQSIENRCYGFLAEDIYGDIYFYDNFNANVEIKIGKGKRPKGFVNTNGIIEIFYLHKDNQMNMAQLTFNYTTFEYTLTQRYDNYFNGTTTKFDIQKSATKIYGMEFNQIAIMG